MKRSFAAILLVIALILTALSVNVSAVTEKYKAYEYYYDQLSHDEKLLYDGLKAAVAGTNPTTIKGFDTVPCTGPVSSMEQLNALRDGCAAAVLPLAQNALDAFALDHPEFVDYATGMQTLFGGKAEDGQGEIEVYMQISLTTDAASRYEKAVAEIAKIKATGSDLQKVRTIHDFLCNKNSYVGTNSDAHNLYGALLEGKSVCQGYAHAFKAACDYYGVPCVCITGTGYTSSGSEAHMWNAVKIDGAWYGVDVTWDDQTSDIYDDFFLVGSDTVDTHFQKKSFVTTHVSNGVQTPLSSRKFTYPTLSAKAYAGAGSTPTATAKVTATPTGKPTNTPKPTEVPMETAVPTLAPTAENATAEPSGAPEVTGTPAATQQPTEQPTTDPNVTDNPYATYLPPVDPTEVPEAPTDAPTAPTDAPAAPTDKPAAPTAEPQKKGCKAELSLLILAAILPAALAAFKKKQ